MNKGRRFSLVWARRGFHGRMAVCGNAALAWVGTLFTGPRLLLLGPGLYLRDHFLLKLFKACLTPTLNVSAVSHVLNSSLVQY